MSLPSATSRLKSTSLSPIRQWQPPYKVLDSSSSILLLKNFRNSHFQLRLSQLRFPRTNFVTRLSIQLVPITVASTEVELTLDAETYCGGQFPRRHSESSISQDPFGVSFDMCVIPTPTYQFPIRKRELRDENGPLTAVIQSLIFSNNSSFCQTRFENLTSGKLSSAKSDEPAETDFYAEMKSLVSLQVMKMRYFLFGGLIIDKFRLRRSYKSFLFSLINLNCHGKMIL
jgi:hypothetical protein